MKYRGYVTKAVQQTIPIIGTRTAQAIFWGDRLMAYVDNDREFIKHVIDEKIRQGAWLDVEAEAQSAGGVSAGA